jgi:hypothetical protein
MSQFDHRHPAVPGHKQPLAMLDGLPHNGRPSPYD